MSLEFYSFFNGIYATPTPDISIYAEHCIIRRRHTKRRMQQYGRV